MKTQRVSKKKAKTQGILTFKLPDDRNEFEIAVKSMDWALTSWDLDLWLRNKLKYGHEFKTAGEALGAVRIELREIMEEYGISLDDIQ